MRRNISSEVAYRPNNANACNTQLAVHSTVREAGSSKALPSLLTHDDPNEDKTCCQAVDGIAGKGASREPEPVDAGIVEAGEPYGRTRSHVLLQGTQHHHRGRGVQHVVGGDVELVVHRLVHTVHTYTL